MTTELTADEEAEFTLVNCLAFDLARKNAQDRDTRLPAWLCMSDEAKNRYRQDLVAMLNTELAPIVSYSAFDLGQVETLLQRYLAGTLSQDMLSRWRQIEVELKGHRAAGNPQAFFA